MRCGPIRRIVQILVLAVLVVIGTDLVMSSAACLPWFSRFSPLMTLTTRLAAHQWTPYFFGGTIVFFLSAVFPRFFCGWVCPVGTCIDIVDTVTLAGKRTLLKTPFWAAAWLLDAGLIAAAMNRYEWAGYLDPLTFFAHTLAFFMPQKNSQLIQSAFADTGTELILPAVFFGALALTVLGRRTWCRMLCPLGGLLGLAGTWGLFRRQVNNNCIQCGKCRKQCPMTAIPADPHQTKYPACISCRHCSDICPRKAIRFR